MAFKVGSAGLNYFQIACLIERDFWQYLPLNRLVEEGPSE